MVLGFVLMAAEERLARDISPEEIVVAETGPSFAVSSARVGKVVDLEVSSDDAAEARAQVEKMCEQLLANPLMESYEIELHG